MLIETIANLYSWTFRMTRVVEAYSEKVLLQI